jgi:hypothetical protein
VEEPADCLESPRVLWAAALTVAAAVVAVLVVREIAVRVLHPGPAFAPLFIAPPVVDTILCTVVAIFVFIKIMFGANPLRTWRLVATGVLILSFTTRRIIGEVTQYGRNLARGLRSHGDARSGVGALCNALTGTCDHEAPSENTGPGLGAPVDSVRFGAANARAL